MTLRALAWVGWALVVAAAGCLVGLEWLLIGDVDRWEGWQLALLLHAALGCGLAAHGLCWRRGGPTLQMMAQAVAVVAVVAWLYTWFEPLAEGVAWLRLLGSGWFGP